MRVEPQIAEFKIAPLQAKYFGAPQRQSRSHSHHDADHRRADVDQRLAECRYRCLENVGIRSTDSAFSEVSLSPRKGRKPPNQKLLHRQARDPIYLAAPRRIRTVRGHIPSRLRDRADERWATATRAHYNRDLQFNSQSLIVAMTPERAIGGRAWPSVVFEEPDHEYAFALWCNSTLGLLCHWWMSNKTQAGRGTTTVTSIPTVATLNVRALSEAQHAQARIVFELLSDLRLLPFDQVDEDEARAELDRRLLVEVLGLNHSLVEPGGPMERLRRKLAAEPQIHGDKQTRLVFTPRGEASVPRGEGE